MAGQNLLGQRGGRARQADQENHLAALPSRRLRARGIECSANRLHRALKVLCIPRAHGSGKPVGVPQGGEGAGPLRFISWLPGYETFRTLMGPRRSCHGVQ